LRHAILLEESITSNTNSVCQPPVKRLELS
jgi:hypothetical protein